MIHTETIYEVTVIYFVCIMFIPYYIYFQPGWKQQKFSII